VDRVFDTEEIVVKPVTPILRHLTVFGGTTILGDGSVIMILDPGGIARAAGTAGDGRADGRSDGRLDDRHGGGTDHLEHSDDHTAILLFRAGGGLLAVPLGLVARLEEIARERIEFADVSADGAMAVTQYRGQLMPLVPIASAFDRERETQRVLVFSQPRDGAGPELCMGLVVDEIVDVVDQRLQVALSSTRAGLLGTAIIDGRAAGVLDTRYWLTRTVQDWFGGRLAATRSRQQRLLVVEDSDFFRQLLIPTLSTAGFVVTAAAGASQALKLRDNGVAFDVIVSDIEMPEVDGLAFARRVRAGGAWADLPMVALSGRARPKDIAAARDAGFTDFVEKFEPDKLLACLRKVLAESGAGDAERASLREAA
jgi:two-component system chemotaxis sensor kinase CheA